MKATNYTPIALIQPLMLQNSSSWSKKGTEEGS